MKGGDMNIVRKLSWETYGLMFVLVGLVFVTINTRNEKMRVAKKAADAVVQQEELRTRLDAAIPHRQGKVEVVTDDFELIRIIDMHQTGARIIVSDLQTGMVCSGRVAFTKGSHGGNFDTLRVYGCYDPEQPDRYYEAGVLQK
ncbi:MAG: hypothetical protein UU11_C0002G0179 [Parcubacteria group bacterium GW2011_GWF2_40_69]|nr:MAG: hypothetical protein UT25_C0002G0113 [Parcubacteria group bacterium GW2011_GWC1_39_12]KKR19388.1 MAG: hypothetical protein UT49_C0002G0234 [Parcubacteria group bacterium GW2011_GWF1_39_37]KKR35230.1 MAG: hypothetical protein UT68_C0004G0038 [Parcubacteria group bacterium GW2011_GWC2_40_10]KKR52337.1 MAG: hypothetical protein UT89_C0002G0138 [Parcubacteria group bacterium GW2011_GWE1_40_20]KKR69381.1 MAG: hypothetical protein UU11_C0002G0179 [Parcubacteria group bacterium GW2011_GWF2_40_